MSDRATGQPLEVDVVGAAVARTGGVRSQDSTQTYIRVKLTRPVPADGGEARVLIDKTYEDASSYFLRGDTIVFSRPLGIKRNAVVLPKGYELVSCNFPSQVLQETDGRIGITFWNNTPSEAALMMRAVRVGTKVSGATTSSVAAKLGDRAHQNREIVYFLQQPETHAFDLYHDYTESRPGTSNYINEVRAGSTVANPRAMNLDTGEQLKFEIVRARRSRARSCREQRHADLEGVVCLFLAGEGCNRSGSACSRRTDTALQVCGRRAVWDRAGSRRTVVLPADGAFKQRHPGAYATGRPVRPDFINPARRNRHAGSRPSTLKSELCAGVPLLGSLAR